MRRSASEVINNLENRIARLERKSASQNKPTLILEGWGENGEQAVLPRKVQCELTIRSLLACVKKELNVDCWFDTDQDDIFLSNREMTIQVWCDNYEETGIYYATFSLKGHSHNAFKILPVQ